MGFTSIFLMSVMIYIYITLLLRMFGKKEFSQLNVYDFVVFLIVAELMTISIGDDSITFLHSVVATIALVVVDRLLSFITIKNKKLRDHIEGRPSYIIFQGVLNQSVMKELRYSVNDLFMQLRIEGVNCIEEVQFAILETNGNLSILLKEECNIALPDAVIVDGCIDTYNLNLLGYDAVWLNDQLALYECKVNEVFLCIVTLNDLYIIKKQP